RRSPADPYPELARLAAPQTSPLLAGEALKNHGGCIPPTQFFFPRGGPGQPDRTAQPPRRPTPPRGGVRSLLAPSLPDRRAGGGHPAVPALCQPTTRPGSGPVL